MNEGSCKESSDVKIMEEEESPMEISSKAKKKGSFLKQKYEQDHWKILQKYGLDKNFETQTRLSSLNNELILSLMYLEKSPKNVLSIVKRILDVKLSENEKVYTKFWRLACKIKEVANSTKKEDKFTFFQQTAVERSFFCSESSERASCETFAKKSRIDCEIVDNEETRHSNTTDQSIQTYFSEPESHHNCSYRYDQLEKKYLEMKKTVKQLRSWKRYHQNSLSKSQFRNESLKKSNELAKKLSRSIKSLRLDLATVKRELFERESTCSCYQNKLESPSKSFVDLKYGNSYSNNTALAVMRLQDLNVSSEKMGRVMEVVGDLAGIEFKSVPSPSTCRNFAVTSRRIAGCHVKNLIEDSISKGESLCLASDETTKGTVKLQAFGYHSQDGTFTCIGIEQVVEKSALTALEALEASITKLPQSSNDFFKKFIVQVQSTISDSASTESKFNKLIENFRNAVIPEVIEDYTSWSDGEKKSFSKFLQFFCQLHFISNFTKVVLKSLLEHELSLSGEKKIEEPSVLTLIKLVSQYFGQRGAGLHGLLSVWVPWCRKFKICRFVFESFLGNRFNIVFFLATRVFYHRKDLVNFCEEYENCNAELKNIRQLLQTPMIVDHLQVLGFCDQLITAPLWRLAEGSQHVLDTCLYAKELKEWLEECKNFPTSFFDGCSPVPNLQVSSPTTSSLLIRELVDSTPSADALGVAALVSTASLEYFGRVFEGFLPGGSYYNEADEIREITQSAPATNRNIESVFGLISHLFDTKPNMRLDVRVAITLIRKNRSIDWLNSLSENERNEVMSNARKALAQLKSDSKEQQSRLDELILQKMREKHQNAAKKLSKQMSDRKTCTRKIVDFGFWETEIDITKGLEKLNNEKMKREAVVSQLRYRQKVIKQPGPTSRFYSVTAASKPLPLDILIDKIRFLQKQDKERESSDDHELVGKRIEISATSTSGSTKSAFVVDVRNRNGKEYATLQNDDDDASTFLMPLQDLTQRFTDGSFILT